MSQLSQRSVIRCELLDDDLLLSSVIIDQIKKLRSLARTEVDMSTLRIGFERDGLHFFIRTTVLEAVTVGSEWVPVDSAFRLEHGRVLTIDYRGEPDRPWITLDNGWGGRLDYFHRYYARHVDPVNEVPKVGSYWIMTHPIGVGTKWRCAYADPGLASPQLVTMIAVNGDGDEWSGTVADFNNHFRRCSG